MSDTLEKIYVVFKTHFDIGFTGLASEVAHLYSTEMLEHVIDICEKTKHRPEHEKYVWTMSAWPLLQSLSGSTEQDRAKADEFVQNRQLIWHKLPFTTHTEFCGMEEWIRGMYISRGLTERYGYNPRDAKMTDVPGHTWIVPSLLKKAGVDILHLGCNSASTPPDVPPVFYWEGPDGERLLTFYSKGGYGTGILPPKEWEHPVWLALIHTNDNEGPHQASVIDEMKDWLVDNGMRAELHIGSLTDFAQDFLSRNPQLPVVRGDLADSWIHGVGTAPREVSRIRELRGRITAAESALALSLFNGANADGVEVKKLIDYSYEQTLLFGEHTWGMDCKTFLFPRTYDKKSFLKEKTSPRYQKMEDSWQEQRDYLNRAEDSLLQATEEMAAGTGGTGPGKVRRLRVYNHLGWVRDAEIHLSEELLPLEGEVWIDGSTGVRLETAARPDAHGLNVIVKSLPALGYKTIVCVNRENAENGTASGTAIESGRTQADITDAQIVLQNSHLTVKVNRATGFLTSLYDKKTGKEWIDENASYGFGQYEYNIYSNIEITRYLKKYSYRFYDWGIHDQGKTGYPEEQKRLSFTSGHVETRVVQEGLGVRVECSSAGDPASFAEYGNAREIIWSLFLAHDAAHLDMEWHLLGKEETPKAESGHVVFPLKAQNPKYRINKMGSVLDPCTDLIPSSSTLLYCCEHFVDVSDGEAGLAFIPLDSPLFFIGRNGMWDFEPDYRPEKPELNFNLFNNWWGTNFPQWLGGGLRYRFRLVPHRGDWRTGQVWRIAQETMTPAFTVPAGTDAQSEALVEMLPGGLDGMSVTCFKPAEDGNGSILRLRDWMGVSRETVIGLGPRVEKVHKTDLLEYDGEPVELLLSDANVGGRQIRLPIQGFEVVTLRIR